MKVGITGASGFVGGVIARSFADAGWSVVRMGRGETNRYDLSGPVALDSLAGLDALVHAAYADDADNVAALARLRDAARASGVQTLAFISSFAASAAAESLYGKEKYLAESELDPTRDLIVRPGLVAGSGGLYGSMRRIIARFGLAPVFGDGAQPVYVVEAGQLGRAIVALVESRSRGVFACASPQPISFRDLCAEIAATVGRRVRYVRLPLVAVLAIACFMERLGLKAPVSSESVRGVANLGPVDVPIYPQIGFAFLPPGDAVRRAERPEI